MPASSLSASTRHFECGGPLGASWLAATIGLIALLNPHNVLLALTDFYPDALALPLLGSALWALETRRYRLLLIASGGLVLVREDFAFAVIGLGLFVLLARRNDVRWLGPALGAFGLLYLLAMVGAVIPLIAGRPYLYGDLNPDLGSGPLGLTVGILRDPLAALRHLMSPPGPDYLFWLFGPLLGLPLLRPLHLVPGLPLLLRNLLSNNGNLVSINRHYHVAIVPTLLAATAGALAILPRRWARLAAVALVTAALVFDGYAVAGLVITSELPVEPGPEAAAYREALRLIPPDGAVAASNRLGAHLAARRHLWSFASGGAQAEPTWADWIAVDLDDHDGPRTDSAEALLARLRTSYLADQFREVFREGFVVLLCRRTEPRCQG